MRLNVKTYTFGCKVNRADTVAIENRLRRHPFFNLSRKKRAPDIVIINTCTVTASADRQARQMVRRFHRSYPGAEIVLTGCYAQAEPDLLGKMDGVTSILPIQEQHRFCELFGFDTVGEETAIQKPEVSENTRVILKMQEGCNAYCSFCVLPYVRGRSRSIPIEILCREASRYERSGYKEIVVTGTHIGAYGRDLAPRVRFSNALAALAKAAPRTTIRVSSMEPTAVTPDFVELMASDMSFRPHFHIPLQSGSDWVLKRMNRKYRVEHFQRRIETLARTRKSVSIGTDVITGFPDESAKEHEATCNLIRSLPLTYLHVFPFSPRRGTRAWTFRDNIAPEVKHERVRVLRDLGGEMRQAFFQRFLGTVQSVLVEKKRDRWNRLGGYTPHYIPVRFQGAACLINQEIDVLLERVEGEFVVGKVVECRRVT